MSAAGNLRACQGTALDRLIESIDDESPVSRESQIELVADLLARREADLCRTCLIPFRDSFCDVCGAIQKIDRALALDSDGAARQRSGGTE